MGIQMEHLNCIHIPFSLCFDGHCFYLILFLPASFHIDMGWSLTCLLLACHPEHSCESDGPVYPSRLDLLSSIHFKATSPLLTLCFLLAHRRSLPLLHNSIAFIASLVIFFSSYAEKLLSLENPFYNENPPF